MDLLISAAPASLRVHCTKANHPVPGDLLNRIGKRWHECPSLRTALDWRNNTASLSERRDTCQIGTPHSLLPEHTIGSRHLTKRGDTLLIF
jgi:hypothetical protein